MLDEPTNHLDLNARDALSMALQDYPGAMVVVSHDRHLLRSVADDLWLVADGQVQAFNGDLEEYGRWLGSRRNANRDASADTPATPARKEQRKLDADKRKQLKTLQTAVNKAETVLNTLSVQRKALEDQLACPTLYTDEGSAKAQLARLLKEKSQLDRQVDEAEACWLEASTHLETALL